MPASLVRWMTMTHEDFLRTLPDAAAAAFDAVDRRGAAHAPVRRRHGSPAYRIEGDKIVIGRGRRRVHIRLEPEPPRRAGAMRLPILRASFDFSGFDEAEPERFLDRFDLYYRRGGG
jgi:hypothetical protein